MTKNEIKQFVQQCRHSSTYFIESCCKIKHPLLGIIPVRLFKYQKNSLHSFRKHRFSVFKKCRQCGVSTLTGIYALWVAMFFAHKKILIVSKRDEDAKNFLGENIKLVYHYLPDWMKEIWVDVINNEHELGFANGSTIKSLTSSPDTLRSNASFLNIIDEAAFMPDMEIMWSGGWSCVDAYNTYLYEGGRITPIGQTGNLYGPQWQDISSTVQSDAGIENSDKFYINGEADVNDIVTTLGFRIRCTDNHRLKDAKYQWTYSKDIEIGQKLSLKCGADPVPSFDTKLIDRQLNPHTMLPGKNSNTVNPTCSHCNKAVALNYRQYKRNLKLNSGYFICVDCATTMKMSPDFDHPSILDDKLAEMVGYYIGDGWASINRPKRLQLCYDPQDQDIYTHFADYLKGIGLEPHKTSANGADELRINNAKFVDWFVLNGFNSKTDAHDARVPNIILQSHESIRLAFIRGLFEADGWCYRTHAGPQRPNSYKYHLGMSSVSEGLIDQMQLMLLNSGVIAKKTLSKGGYANSGKSWRLEVINLSHMVVYMDRIGFISRRKSPALSKHTSMQPSKYGTDHNGIFHDTVASITRDRCLTVDRSVPTNNTYIANGFVSHNTLQHGGNCIVISCVPRGTYVFTDKGPQLIDNFIDPSKIGGYTIPEYKILGRDKLRNGELFYNSGIAETKKIITRHGEIICGHKHKLLRLNRSPEWVAAKEVKAGDRLGIQYGLNIWGNENAIDEFKPSINVKYPYNPQTITPELAYILGLYIAEGCAYKFKHCNSAKITISCGDDIRGSIAAAGLPFTCTDGLHYNIHCTNLYELMEHLGFNLSARANNKAIPESLLRCSPDIIGAILRGMFDGDGCCQKRGVVSYTTTSRKLAIQVRVILNNFGIITTHHVRTAKAANKYMAAHPSSKIKAKRHNFDTHIIELSRAYSYKFGQLIGFGFSRKQKAINPSKKIDVYDVIPNGKRLCQEMFSYLPFGSWVLTHKYKLNLNVALSNKAAHKKSVARATVLRLFEVAKEYLPDDVKTRIADIVSPTLIWTEIKSIVENGAADIYDFSLPNNEGDKYAHSIIYDGFVGHQTPNGQGNWYHDQWTGADTGEGLFNPILINWWDMDWVIEGYDQVSNQKVRIAPTDKIRKCTTKADISKWGPYCSPWLENEYKALRARGEAHLFRQEVLAEFIGSGGSLLNAAALYNVESMVKSFPENEIKTFAEPVPWINQSTGDSEMLDFTGVEAQEGLWVWKEPVKGGQAKYQSGRLIDTGDPAHTYVVGVDIATGENNDFSAIEIFDINTMEQVAEYMGHVKISTFAKMVDWIGRWYNTALVIPERSGIGSPFVQDIRSYMYPNLWRAKKLRNPRPGATKAASGVSLGLYGFSTTGESKPTLNKALLTYISENEGEGYTIYSSRLYKQLQIYIRHKNRQGLATKKTGAQTGRGNHDDLVIAAALAFHAIPDSVGADPDGLLPIHSKQAGPALVAGATNVPQTPPPNIYDTPDQSVMVPITFNSMNQQQMTPQEQLDAFARQLTIAPTKIAAVKTRKAFYTGKKQNGPGG